MKVGIVGHGADKFSDQAKSEAISIIFDIFQIHESPIIVSGHSPVGGIDIWAETLAVECELGIDIKTPKQHQWDAEYGFKQRNLDIAKESDELHVILVSNYPKGYKGRKFNTCYHCNNSDHIKSGACWTAKHHKEITGKDPIYHIIKNEEA